MGPVVRRHRPGSPPCPIAIWKPPFAPPWPTATASSVRERAEREERTALTLEPDFTFPHDILGILAIDRGEWLAAQEHLEAFGFPRSVVRPIIAARRDPSQRRRAILAIDSTRRSLGANVLPEAPAMLYGVLDVPDSVLAYLERGLAQRSEAALLLTRNPILGSAIHDPRMAELRARYGLPN